MTLGDGMDVSAAYDANSLHKLHQQASQSGSKSLPAVARQVEGLFVQMMLKSMRAALPKDGLFNSSQSELYTSMYDQQIAQQLSSKGLGLADMMVKQLSQPGSAPKSDAGNTGLVPGPLPALDYMTPALQGEFFRRNQQQNAPAAAPMTPVATGNSFTDRLSVPAMIAASQSGISHHLILAQAALESGWGKREIPTSDGKQSYNLFGIKASGDWKGKSTQITTTEYQNGQPVKIQQRFRVYDSYLEAIGDYVKLLSANPRYREVVNAARPEDAAYALQRAGYATDPNYGAKLVQIINQLKNGAQQAVKAYTHDLSTLF